MTRNQRTCAGVDQFGKATEVDLLHGEYKRWPNNPVRADGRIDEYCPPVHVDAEMERLIELHLAHEAEGVPPEVSSAWLHHRFTQIHPFQDGNGRMHRCLIHHVLAERRFTPPGMVFPVSPVMLDRIDAYRMTLQAHSGPLMPWGNPG